MEPINRYERHFADAVVWEFKQSTPEYRYLSTVDIESFYRWEAKELVVRFTQWLYGTHPTTISIHEKYPKDWWEAFKERWLPQWFLKRVPVQYKHIDVERTIYTKVCPHIENERATHLEWLVAKPEEVEEWNP